MKLDVRKPSLTVDTYWIVAINEGYRFKKKRAERLSGKWLIFEPLSKIDETWEKVKEATLNGLLGPSSKVSTAKPNPNAKDVNTKVICVFTEDFNDKEDVERVKNALRALNINNDLFYKLDKDVGKYEKDGHKNLIQLIDKVE